MASDKGFHDYAMERLAVLGGVSSKSMFGGWGIFEGGRMFALIWQADLYFKADDSTRGAYEAEGCEQFRNMPYFMVPAEVLENDERIAEWGGTAVAVAHSAPAKPKR